jgi:hypothetical protein
MKYIISSEDSNRQVTIDEISLYDSSGEYLGDECIIAFCEHKVPQLEITVENTCYSGWFDIFTNYIVHGVTIGFEYWLNRIILNEETEDVLYTLKEVKFNYDLNNSLIEGLRDIKYRRLAIPTSDKDDKDDEDDEYNEDEEDFKDDMDSEDDEDFEFDED